MKKKVWKVVVNTVQNENKKQKAWKCEINK